MATKKSKLNIEQQAQEVLKQAESAGLKANFFFATTFRRYQVQMQIMEDLEKAIEENGATVEKEYVKDRKNIYTNPAISEYNKTATAANNTVGTLINIMKSLTDTKQAQTSKLRSLMDELNSD